LDTYEACSALLAAELGIEPEPETAALAERIRTRLLPAQHQAHRATPQPRHPDTSVAFLGNLFTGRDGEYQGLVNSYERAAAGQPQLVVLRGEAGIGKTRLARKFLTWADEQGAELLQGSAFESGSHLPFQPLVEALRLRLKSDNLPKDLLADVWQPALSQLMPEWPGHAPALPRAAGEAEIEQVQLFEPLVQLTLALCQQEPLVLFIDDLQWTDSATLDLLHYAIRRWQEIAAQKNNPVRTLLLVSLRSEAMHPMTQPLQAGVPQGLIQWLARLTRELTPVHIELEPLSERETVQLVLSILSPPTADFAKWLYAETHGQPFYLMETLKDLLERQVLHPKRRSERQWTFAVDAVHDLGQAVRVPSTVHAVIRSRLNRLSPHAFSLLAGGAVLEQRLSFQRLCAISNVSEDLALPAVDELISGRLLLEAALPSAASEYTFVNEMLRDVVYTEAGDARRRLFHQRALEILAAAGDSAAVLAHHALAAGLAQAAFRHSLAAGREALRILAVGEATVHFESARQFVQEASLSEMPTKADLRDLYKQLDRVYQLAGQMKKASAVSIERKRFLPD
jgi:predicted ATPase